MIFIIINFRKKILINILICSLISICSCYYEAGTLGGGSVYKFTCSREELQSFLNSFSDSSLDNQVPNKWKSYDNWHEKGYDFLNGNVFYFKSNNNEKEEMYYVTLVKSTLEDTTNTKPSYLSIRAVFDDENNIHKWKYMNSFNEKEYLRIETRFEREILDKFNSDSCHLIKKIKDSDWLNR